MIDTDRLRSIPRAAVDPASRFGIGLLGIAAVTAALTALVLPVPASGPALVLVGAALTVAFLAADSARLSVHGQRDGWTVTFGAIPLVIALLVAPFGVAIAAHLLAFALRLPVRPRRPWHIVACDVGVLTAEATTAYLVAHLVAVTWFAGAAVAPPWWLGPLAGVAAAQVLGCALTVYGSSLLAPGTSRAAGLRRFRRMLATGLLNAVAGLVGYQVAVGQPWGGLLVILLAASLIGVYGAYPRMLREQRDLVVLHELSGAVAALGNARPRSVGEAFPHPRPGGDELTHRERAAGPTRREPASGEPPEWEPSEWERVAELVRAQLAASRVVLHLAGEPAHTIVAGVPLPPGAPAPTETALRVDPLLRLPGPGAHRLRRAGAAPDVAAALRHRRATEALVAPLWGSDALLGVVEAHDRQSRWRGFDAADTRLLATLASHLATGLDNRRLLLRVRHDAYHDPLTGLPNRLGFLEYAGARSAGVPGAVLVIDLDALAPVNEAVGHAWGDQLVVLAGKRIRAVLGPDALLARLEGDCFAALLGHVGPGAAELVATSLREQLIRPYALAGLVVRPGAAIGLAASTTSDLPGRTTVAELLRQADVALQVARGCPLGVLAYLPSMGERFDRRFQLVTRFRRSLAGGEVEVYYQPKVSLAGRAVVGAEALVRWQHPEFGLLEPEEFVSVIEATGLIDALTDFVLGDALARCRGWLDRGLRMAVAVNLSVRNLDETRFSERVAGLLSTHRVPAELLTLEITESAMMRDPERVLPVLRALHTMGVTLAVDDFGTGHSSLAYLRRLPVDEVKIDKSFVLGMATELDDAAVVRAIVELGHTLGLTVVAEGVEEEAVRESLTGMGCDIVQGYLVSRPLPAQRFDAWLASRTVAAPAVAVAVGAGVPGQPRLLA